MSRTYNVAPNPNDSAFSIVPIGAMLQWGSTTAPSGWFLCDGTAVSRSTYVNLFSVLGTTYGVGNGSTTFNLPDTRTRAIRGAGTSYSLGATGGVDTATLTATNLPNHSHTLVDPQHNHPAVFQGNGYASVDGANGNRANFPGTTSSASTGITMTESLLSGGTQVSQTAVSLVNPYAVINSIIKHS